MSSQTAAPPKQTLPPNAVQFRDFSIATFQARCGRVPKSSLDEILSCDDVQLLKQLLMRVMRECEDIREAARRS